MTKALDAFKRKTLQGGQVDSLTPEQEPEKLEGDAFDAAMGKTFIESGLGTNSLKGKEAGDVGTEGCVPNKVVDYNPESDAEPKELDYDAEVTITVGDILDLHRKLSYCLRGNQRPAVLSCQALLIELLPEGTPIIHREPIA